MDAVDKILCEPMLLLPVCPCSSYVHYPLWLILLPWPCLGQAHSAYFHIDAQCKHDHHKSDSNFGSLIHMPLTTPLCNRLETINDCLIGHHYLSNSPYQEFLLLVSWCIENPQDTMLEHSFWWMLVDSVSTNHGVWYVHLIFVNCSKWMNKSIHTPLYRWLVWRWNFDSHSRRKPPPHWIIKAMSLHCGMIIPWSAMVLVTFSNELCGARLLTIWWCLW